MATLTKAISGWGRHPVQTCELERPERYKDLTPAANSIVARGQGRSYGDAALNENGRVILTERINRFLELDLNSGILRAEAGVTLAEILDVIVPKGWFLPVTPGTKFVSLGGCVAADVHGKNHHHEGSFGAHVLSIELILADNSHITCSATTHSDTFWATVGGMGLTGIIGEVTLQLIPVQTAYVKVQHHQAQHLQQLFQQLQDPALDDRYTVAWIDCLSTGDSLGRGVVMCGHHATAADLPADSSPFSIPHKRKRAIPFYLPSWAMNSFSIGTFNALYYRHEGSKQSPFLSDYDTFFYPLDAINDWNRLYGKQGFVQYQCVIPDKTAYDGIKSILEILAKSKRSSFLAVLKRFGAEGSGMLSFPLAGYTLALDLPMRDAELFNMLDQLDKIVIQHGGRVYLAKDARLSAASFQAMYPRYHDWFKVKTAIDPNNRFSSSLSRRLRIGEDHE